jgi:hypothetical protein
MPNAIDMYRAQQTAANEVHAKLSEVATLVQRVRLEVNALAQDHRIQEVLRQEHTWLEQAERTVKEVQRWRDLEAYRFWPGVVYRCAFALAFSLFAVWIAGAGYAWMIRDRDRELTELRSRLERLGPIEQRISTLSPAEQRQLDALLKGVGSGSGPSAAAHTRRQ